MWHKLLQMRRLIRLASLIAFFLLTSFAAVTSAAQQVSLPVPISGEATCTSPATVTVTVFLNKSSAVIPKAYLLLRGVAGKSFQVELQTDADGRATASVPCGYVDIFATARNFAPNAKRVGVEKDRQFLAISLDASPLAQY
jgi:hypothetical protein